MFGFAFINVCIFKDHENLKEHTHTHKKEEKKEGAFTDLGIREGHMRSLCNLLCRHNVHS